MKFLVTGAGGFVGSHLVRELLRSGHSVSALLRPEGSAARLSDSLSQVRVLRADLRDQDQVGRILREAKPECTVHLAWYAAPGKYWTAPENLDCVSMTLSLAQALIAAGCKRLVGVGSCAEYDWDYGWLSESHTPLKPRTLYGVCKTATRMMLESLCALSEVSFAWCRLFYLYGPDESPERLVPSVTLALLRGEVARCTEGKQLRDFLHVDDVAAAIGKVAASDCRGAVNIGSGEPVRVRRIVELIGQTLDRSDRIKYGAVAGNPDDPALLVADVRRLHEEVGWSPLQPLEEAVPETVRWWRGRQG